MEQQIGELSCFFLFPHDPGDWSRDSPLSAVAMMHAARRACLGALKGSKCFFPVSAVPKTSLNSLPSCLISRMC